MARFTAPKHTTQVFLPSGPVSADKDGVITMPDDASAADLAGLARAGCVPEAAKAAAPVVDQKKD